MPGAIRCGCGILLLALVATSSRADETADPQQLLAQMASAMRDLDYDGSFIYEHDGRVDTLRVFHAGGVDERERLISLNGARREVVRNSRSITSVQPNQLPTVFGAESNRRLVPLVPEARAEGLQENYTLRLIGEDRIAGFSAQVIDVQATDKYRYSYRLWLEKNSHLLLRSMLLDADQHSLQQLMFVALNIGGHVNETDLALSEVPARTIAAQAQEVLLTTPSEWKLGELPAGFSMSARRGPADATNNAEHWLLSDGVANVSVYLEPANTAPGVLTQGKISRGVLNVFVRNLNGYQVTALGEVPPATVEKIADALTHAAPAVAH
ncbi:MucB/RseB C-terminal domain-containing protein [Pseudolysobacter antarcticus]|nr:MucB/RseB C-terminal domain-containing protein [Pseudolysobacter antarcticus]